MDVDYTIDEDSKSVTCTICSDEFQALSVLRRNHKKHSSSKTHQDNEAAHRIRLLRAREFAASDPGSEPQRDTIDGIVEFCPLSTSINQPHRDTNNSRQDEFWARYENHQLDFGDMPTTTESRNMVREADRMSIWDAEGAGRRLGWLDPTETESEHDPEDDATLTNTARDFSEQPHPWWNN